jgi:hypothetical protein
MSLLNPARPQEYAERNLKEWKRRGKEVVGEMANSPRLTACSDARIPPPANKAPAATFSILDRQSSRKPSTEHDLGGGSIGHDAGPEPESLDGESSSRNSDSEDGVEKVEVQLVRLPEEETTRLSEEIWI